MADFVVSRAVNFIIVGAKHLNFVDNDRVKTDLTANSSSICVRIKSTFDNTNLLHFAQVST